MNNRIVFIDVARSFAILLALLDHSMNDFHVWSNYEFSNFAIIKAITSSATPTFIFIFGMMIEVIYLRRLNTVRLDGLVPGLVKRSFQCYRGYAFTAIAGFIGGILSFNTMIAAFMFFGKTHYGNILKLYTFYMILAVPILLFRKKFGINKLVLLVLSFWVIYPLLQMVQVGNYHISVFTSLLLGFGGKEGPSILYASTIVVAGMYVASFISNEKTFQFLKVNLLTMLVIGGLLGGAIYWVGADSFVENYFSNTYRYNSHPIYYMCGIFLALTMTTIFSIVFPIGSYLKSWMNPFMIFGQQSLSAFTWANVFLNLMAIELTKHHWNELGPITFVIFIFIFLHSKQRLEQKEILNFGFVKTMKNFWYKKILRKISDRVIISFSSKP